MSETHGADPVPVVAITSPPYADANSRGDGGCFGGEKGIWGGDGLLRLKKNYAVPDTEGQIGALPDPVPVVAVTSPPYAESLHANGTSPAAQGVSANGKRRGGSVSQDYGDTPGQIGALRDTEPDAPTARPQPADGPSAPAQAILPLDGIPAISRASPGRNPYQPACPDWHGLYQGSTSRDDALFRPESTAHPAKMSIALTRRILETMQGWGWLQPGGLCIDPFGGRGTTAAIWCAMAPENRALTVELEAHFVKMERDNQAHAERKLRRSLPWEIIRGDSRFCAALLAGDLSTTRALVEKERAALEAVWRDDWRAVAFQPFDGYAAAVGKPWVCEAWPDREPVGGVCCTSPPYGDSVKSGEGPGARSPKWVAENVPGYDPKVSDNAGKWASYGDTPGNLGNLPDREACVTSPKTNSNGCSEIPLSYEQPQATGRRRSAAALSGRGEHGEYRAAVRGIADDGEAGAGPTEHPAAQPQRTGALDGQDALRPAPGEDQDQLRRAGTPELQNREVEPCLSDGGEEGSLRAVRLEGAAGRPSPRSEPREQHVGEPRGPVSSVPPVGPQDGVLGGLPGRQDASEGNRACGVGAGTAQDRSPDEDVAGQAKGVSACFSPPFEAQSGGNLEKSRQHQPDPGIQDRCGYHTGSNGTAAGQVGQLQSESYEMACLAVYRGLAEAGVRFLAVVVKCPTRGGKLRRLDQATARLLRQAGYKIRAWRKAVLFETPQDQEQRHGQGSLFDGDVEPSKKVVGRLSFFRRLHLNKGGVAADCEHVYFAELAAGAGGCAVTSSPYADAEMGLKGEGPGAAGNARQRARIAAGVPTERAAQAIGVGYGTTPGNLGNLRDPEPAKEER